MIRAHMATFPPRKEMMLLVVERMAPQVDKLFIALNEYDKVPDELARFPNVEAVIPDDNLIDVGKFYFPVQKDDYICTLDDDLIYPENYVATYMGMTKKIDMQRNMLGVMGTYAERAESGKLTMKGIWLRRRLGRFTGVDIMGSGTAFFSGHTFPSYEQMKDAQRITDLRNARIQYQNDVKIWAIPRPKRFLDAHPSSFERGLELHKTHTPQSRAAERVEFNLFFGKSDHIGKNYAPYWSKKRQEEALIKDKDGDLLQ